MTVLPKTTATRQALDRQADHRGWLIEGDDDRGYRLVNATTGTMVAGRWTNPDGYGLTVAEVAAIVNSIVSDVGADTTTTTAGSLVLPHRVARGSDGDDEDPRRLGTGDVTRPDGDLGTHWGPLATSRRPVFSIG